jgi:hypothetical protein
MRVMCPVRYSLGQGDDSYAKRDLPGRDRDATMFHTTMRVNLPCLQLHENLWGETTVLLGTLPLASASEQHNFAAEKRVRVDLRRPQASAKLETSGRLAATRR